MKKKFLSCLEPSSCVMIANAIIDRLFHHATIVTIKGKSYRLQSYYGEDDK